MRVLKWIGLLLAAVLLLVMAALVILRFVIDPNDFKGQISALVQDASGYQLTLQGDISWSFYPVLGFRSEGVSLVAAEGKPQLLNLRSVALGVELMPLFSRQLKVQQLQLEGLNAQLVVDADGHGNWEVPAAKGQAKAPATEDKADKAAADSEPLPELFIPLIRVVDSNLRYRDVKAGTDLGVTIDSLELRNVQLLEPIALTMKGSLEQADGPGVQFSLDGALQPDLQHQLYHLAPFNLQAQVTGVLPAPLPVSLQSDITVDLAADTAAVKLKPLQVADAKLQIEIQAQAISTAPTYTGSVQSQTLQLPPLLRQLGVALPETAGKDAIKTASLQLSLQGGVDHVRVPSLALQLDQSKLTGSLAVTDFATQALSFDLLLDRINLDDYMPPPDPAAQPGTAAKPEPSQGQAAAELLPLELLRSLNLAGRLRATSVTLQQEEINNIELNIKAKNGVLDITGLQAELLAGRLDGQVSINAKTAEPQLTTVLKVKDVELTHISSRFMQDALLSGKASFDVNTSASGNTTDALLQSALGQLDLQLNEGVLHGININSIVVDALHEQLGNFEMVVPQYQKYLPRELRKDTDISKLLANARLENGHLIMPRFEFFTGESGIDASGKLDLLNQGFDYDFGVVLSALERNKYLKGTRWPVRCEGQLAGAPADWCRPDGKKMGSILRSAASNALKDKTAAELGSKVGLDGADQQQVESELKQKAKAEEDRVKSKLQEKLDKLLNKK